MNKLFTKIAIAALLAAPLAAILPLAAQAAVGGPVCSVPGDYATIQAAVSDVGCVTINVAAGTYPEQVAVNRSVVLNGANMGIAGNGVRVAESVVDGGNTSTPFVITANNVTINGFTVKNGSNGGFFSGIWSQTGTQNSSIMDNVITQNGFGVWAQCGGNCQITDNLFDGNNQPGPGSDGISADSTAGLTINHNEFKNHTAGNPILFQATGAGVHTNLVVSNNSFHDNSFTNVYSIGLNGASFTGNTVSPAADSTGFSFSGADSNVAVTMNTIMNGARGVRVEDAGYGLGANTGIIVNRNDVSNNSAYGVGNITPATALVDATCNWWGAANGPGPVGLGSGSPVTTNVSFASWLTSSNLTSACNGTSNAPVISNVSIHSNNASTTIAHNGDIITLTFTTDQPVTKLGNFKINSSNPDTFTNVGNNYTATHLVDSGDPITGLPVTFQINVKSAAGIFSQTIEATNDGSSVTIVATSVLTTVTVTPATSTIAAMGNDKEKKDGEDGKDGDNNKHGGIVMPVTSTISKKGDDKNKDDENATTTVQLTATDFDQNGGVFLGATTTFSSSNPAVATVDSVTGLVTAVSPGTVTITATSVSGNVTVTGTSVVTVVKGDDNNKKDDGDKGKNDGKDKKGDSDKKPPVVTPVTSNSKDSKGKK